MKNLPKHGGKNSPITTKHHCFNSNIQHICIFLSQPEETQKYKKTYWLVKSTKKGCNLTATPSIYTIFDNNLKRKLYFPTSFQFKRNRSLHIGCRSCYDSLELTRLGHPSVLGVIEEAKSSLSMVNVTSFVSPGASFTFWKPFSSLTGRGREDFLSLMYSWTTPALRALRYSLQKPSRSAYRRPAWSCCRPSACHIRKWYSSNRGRRGTTVSPSSAYRPNGSPRRCFHYT